MYQGFRASLTTFFKRCKGIIFLLDFNSLILSHILLFLLYDSVMHFRLCNSRIRLMNYLKTGWFIAYNFKVNKGGVLFLLASSLFQLYFSEKLSLYH